MSTQTDNALATTEQTTGELAPSQMAALARHEIEGAIVIAQRFPRNEDRAFEMVMSSAKRWGFASIARYSYPRGGTSIKGPSVHLAREIARCWGNIRYGCDIVHDDDDTRTIRGWAWDIQTNTKETQDATFKKLIYRMTGGWSKPDERDLLQLTNKQGAIWLRNCLLHLVPPDLIADAIEASAATMEKGVAEDVDGHRKKIIVAFKGIGVTVEDLEGHLGHPLRQASPTEIADLRAVWKSISDGNSTWSEYAKPTDDAKDKAASGATVDDLTGAKKKKPEPETTKPEASTDKPEPDGQAEGKPEPDPDEGQQLNEYRDEINKAETPEAVAGLLRGALEGTLSDAAKQQISKWCDDRRAVIEKGP